MSSRMPRKSSLKTLLIKHSAFFSKTEKGDDIFYPWMRSGEAFLISARLKNRLTWVLATLTLNFALLIFLVCYLNYNGTMNIVTAAACYCTVISTHFIFYLVYVLLVGRNAEFHTLQKANRPRKLLLPVWIIVLLYINCLTMIYEWGDFSDGIVILHFALLCAGALFISWVLFLIVKTKGYLLEKGSILNPSL